MDAAGERKVWGDTSQEILKENKSFQDLMTVWRQVLLVRLF